MVPLAVLNQGPEIGTDRKSPLRVTAVALVAIKLLALEAVAVGASNCASPPKMVLVTVVTVNAQRYSPPPHASMSLKANRTIPVPAVWLATVSAARLKQQSTALTPSVIVINKCELVLAHCNTEAMSLHLAEIATMVRPGGHAVLLLDQTGWHHSAALTMPPNIALLPPPPKCPKLNVMEKVWQFMSDNWLSNRVFATCKDIVAHCCDAWNRLIDQLWRIISIGMREWVHQY